MVQVLQTRKVSCMCTYSRLRAYKSQVQNLVFSSLACPDVICALSQYYLGGFREDAVAE